MVSLRDVPPARSERATLFSGRIVKALGRTGATATARWDTTGAILAGRDLPAGILCQLPGGYALLLSQAELRGPQPAAAWPQGTSGGAGRGRQARRVAETRPGSQH